MRVRSVQPPDRVAIARILASDETFRPDERDVALELVDSCLSQTPGDDYRVLVWEDAEQVSGYICYGPTPMTERTFDLYWLAADALVRGRGIGTQLVKDMEDRLLAQGPAIVRVETSTMEAYGHAREFYVRRGYDEVGRIRDFYRLGDDLITLVKRLGAL